MNPRGHVAISSPGRQSRGTRWKTCLGIQAKKKKNVRRVMRIAGILHNACVLMFHEKQKEENIIRDFDAGYAWLASQTARNNGFRCPWA